MTLQELLAHNEAIRKQKAAKKAKEQEANNALKEVQQITEEVKKETEPKSKKGRKPKSRAYLVAENLPFEEEDTVAKVVEEENIATDDGDSKLEEEVC